MLLINGLLSHKMPPVHEYWFSVRHCWVTLHYRGQDFSVLALSEGLISVFKSIF